MKISIVTATWNSGKTLRSTLDGVLAQSYTNIEHLIIDGGSKDDTIDIVREYESKYNGRLKWISEKDNGLYDAMNKGINMASGDVIGILNSDDFYTSNDVLERVAKELGTNSELEAVYGDIHYVDDCNLNKCVRYYSSSYFKPWMMRLGFMPAHPSFYCRKDVYLKCGLFDTSFKVAADFEQLLRFIFLNRIPTKYIHKDFVAMRIGGASSSGMTSHKRIIKDHMRAYKKNGVYSNYLLEGMRYLYKTVDLFNQRIKDCIQG
jgi:glycosyltransferase involved in cell wall biosynthesis